VSRHRVVLWRAAGPGADLYGEVPEMLRQFGFHACSHTTSFDGFLTQLYNLGGQLEGYAGMA
jgi:hypothetical protein